MQSSKLFSVPQKTSRRRRDKVRPSDRNRANRKTEVTVWDYDHEDIPAQIKEPEKPFPSPPPVYEVPVCDVKSSETPSEEVPGTSWKIQTKEFFQNVSVTGMGYVMDGDAPVLRRCWWTLLIFFGVGIMVYQITMQVLLYYDYPVRVAIREHFRPTLRFPSVTICSEARFSRKRLRQVHPALEPILDDIFPPFMSSKLLGHTPGTYNMALFSSNWRKTYRDISDKSLNNTFNSCFFQGFKACPPQWLTDTFYDTEQCKTFNSDGALHQLTEGGNAGLGIMVFINQSDQSGILDFTSGFRVILHEPGEVISVWRGIKAAPGFLTAVKVMKEEVHLLPPPYENCGERQLEYFPTYTQSNCHIECLSIKILARCGCLLHTHPGPAKAKVCDPMEERSCAFDTALNFDNNTISDCDCPIECKVTVYKEIVSTAPLGNVFIDFLTQNNLNHGFPHRNFRDDVVVMLVYYPKFSYKTVESKEAYTLIMLFCDMGGALGLLLGSTFFTMYEFVDFFIWGFWKKLKKGNKSP